MTFGFGITAPHTHTQKTLFVRATLPFACVVGNVGARPAASSSNPMAMCMVFAMKVRLLDGRAKR